MGIYCSNFCFFGSLGSLFFIGLKDSLVQELAGKVGQDEAGTVNIRVVVAAKTLLLLTGPGADGLADVAGGVLAADHEADLAGGVGGDGGVGVFGDGEDLLAGLAEVGDQGEMEPLVFGCGRKHEIQTVPMPRGEGWFGTQIG